MTVQKDVNAHPNSLTASKRNDEITIPTIKDRNVIRGIRTALVTCLPA